MPILERDLIPALWLAWAALWWAMSLRVKPTTRHEPMGSRLLHIVPLMLAAALIWVPSLPLPPLDARFLPRAAWPFRLGAALTAAGLLFAAWARLHIGRNWSGTVTLKQDHELVMTGPYAWVRHPIYTGLLLAFAGSAVARAEWRGVLAVVIVFAALWRKLRLEERWMREQFGAAYRAYAERVRALIPYLL